MTLRDKAQDLCDTSDTLSPDTTELLRSGIRLDSECERYTDEVLEQIHAKIEAHAKDIADLQAQILALQEKTRILERKHEQFRSLKAPIRRIPAEVLSYIFLWAIRTPGRSRNCFWHERYQSRWCSGTVDFGRVCTYWRRVVYSTPELWTVISVTVDQEHDNPFKMLTHHLDQSRDLPLDIELHPQRSGTSKTISILLQRRKRWGRLALRWLKYANVMAFLRMLDESPEPLPLRTLEVVIDMPVQNSVDDHLEEILDIIQRTCPSLQTLCLSVPRWSDPATLMKRSSFLTELTHINLSLSIDVAFMIMQLNRRTLISAQFAINVNLNTRSHPVDPDVEQAIIQAVRDKDPVTLPLLQNLSFFIKHIYEYPSLSHQHAAVLLDNMLQVPSLRSLFVECNDYARTSEGRCEGRLELFDSLVGFVTRNCVSSSCLRSLGLLNVPFNDTEALQLLRATPNITHLSVKEDFHSDWFDIFTAGFVKEMEIASGSKDALVPGLKYINLQFPDTKKRDYSGIATMLKSRIGTLLSGYMLFPELNSFDGLSVLSQLGMVLKVGVGEEIFGKKAFL